MSGLVVDALKVFGAGVGVGFALGFIAGFAFGWADRRRGQP